MYSTPNVLNDYGTESYDVPLRNAVEVASTKKSANGVKGVYVNINLEFMYLRKCFVLSISYTKMILLQNFLKDVDLDARTV